MTQESPASGFFIKAISRSSFIWLTRAIKLEMAVALFILAATAWLTSAAPDA